MATALEQMVDCYSTATIGTTYQTLDSYAMGPVCSIPGPHQSGMLDFNGMLKPGVYETMHSAFNNDDFLGGCRNTWYQEPSYNPIGSQDSGFQVGSRGNIMHGVEIGIQERYDFSGHNNNPAHINYDLIGADGAFGQKALGDSHSMDLPGFQVW